MKTFYDEVKKILKDWSRGGYNECEADVFTKLNFTLKKHKDICEECIYKNVWKQNKD